MIAANEGDMDAQEPWECCMYIYSLSLASRVRIGCSIYAPHADRQMGEDLEAPFSVSTSAVCVIELRYRAQPVCHGSCSQHQCHSIVATSYQFYSRLDIIFQQIDEELSL